MGDIFELVGKTLESVVNKGEEILFTTTSGEKYKMYHSQDCCENVTVEDINGDLDDIIGSPVLEASARTSNENPFDKKKEYQESFTWTFYTIYTIKGGVTIRWYGESNGYYSEEVDFVKYL